MRPPAPHQISMHIARCRFDGGAANYCSRRQEMSGYILAIDQGTTSSRAIVFDRRDEAWSPRRRKRLHSIIPQPGWVEHDPGEIWNTRRRYGAAGAGTCRHSTGCRYRGDRYHQPARNDRCLGPQIGSGRCTRRSSGRTGAQREVCDSLKADGYEKLFSAKTGLAARSLFFRNETALAARQRRAACGSAPKLARCASARSTAG